MIGLPFWTATTNTRITYRHCDRPRKRRFNDAGREGRLAYSPHAQGVDASGQSTDLYGRSFSLGTVWDSTILRTMNGLLHRSLIDDGCRFDRNALMSWKIGISGFSVQDTPDSRLSSWQPLVGMVPQGSRDAALTRTTTNPATWQHNGGCRRRGAQKGRGVVSAACGAHGGTPHVHAGDEHESIRFGSVGVAPRPGQCGHGESAGNVGAQTGRCSECGATDRSRNSIGTCPSAGLFLNTGIVEQARGNREAARTWFEKALAMPRRCSVDSAPSRKSPDGGRLPRGMEGFKQSGQRANGSRIVEQLMPRSEDATSQ